MTRHTNFLRPRSASPSGRGFTIVELLVATAIIAVLISLLLPAVSKARDVSMQTACASNYKQIAVAAFNYGTDNNNIAPWLNGKPGLNSYGMLGYGGPTTAAEIKTSPLSVVASGYLGSDFVWNASTSRMLVPPVLVCPGVRKGQYRPYQNATYAQPDLGQVTNVGLTVGFGSFLGLYHNNCSPDRSGTGSNGGVNMRYRVRAFDPTMPTTGSNGLAPLRFDDFFNPATDIMLIDLISCDSSGYSTATSTNWSFTHGRGGLPDGINEGFFDGSVRWFPYRSLNYNYSTTYPWSIGNSEAPIYVDPGMSTSLHKGGYRIGNPKGTNWGWQPTNLDWYGMTTPNSAGNWTP